MNKFSLSHFSLKIIALLSMTIDHIGKFLFAYQIITLHSTAYFILTIIGRLSFPIFIFLIYEGIRKSNHPKTYLMRLGGAFLIALITFLILPLFLKTNSSILFAGNIFVDLVCVAASLYFLIVNKNKYLKFLSLIFPIYLIGMGILQFYLMNGPLYFEGDYFISGLLPQYAFISTAFILIFTITYYFSSFLYKKYSYYYMDNDVKNEFRMQFTQNILISFFILLMCSILYILFKCNILIFANTVDSNIISYMFISVPFILLYNGKLGYKNKLLKYGAYFYYPLHLSVILLVLEILIGG